jgi:hypothetical protein
MIGLHFYHQGFQMVYMLLQVDYLASSIISLCLSKFSPKYPSIVYFYAVKFSPNPVMNK